MIRRRWVIYERKSRQTVSNVYYRRKLALADLAKLNDYCGKKKYAMQLTRFDATTRKVVSRYPNFDLKSLPKS